MPSCRKEIDDFAERYNPFGYLRTEEMDWNELQALFGSFSHEFFLSSVREAMIDMFISLLVKKILLVICWLDSTTLF